MKTDVRRMFDDIAPTYDLLNHVLSLGFDVWWRRRAVSKILRKQGGRFLDIAAGTGDSTIAALRANPRHIVALDLAVNPLVIAGRKFRDSRRARSTMVDRVAGGVAELPFKAEVFDVVFVAFGMRNFENKETSLREILRVLRPDGILCILELSRPTFPPFARMFRWYFHRIVPLAGRLLSGHALAYRYLPDSVDTFPRPEQMVSMLAEAGFTEAGFSLLTWGTAAVYTATKPAD